MGALLLKLETGLARTKAKNLLAITLSATVLTLGAMFGVWVLAIAINCEDAERRLGTCVRVELIAQGLLDQRPIDLPSSSGFE